MPQEDKDQILTIDQSAKLLQVSPWTVYGLVSETRNPGKIFGKKVGRSWRIKREEIDRFLSEEPQNFNQEKVSSSKSSQGK